MSRLQNKLRFGSDPMTLLDQRFLLRVFHLLQDCGMPNQLPERNLLQELYWMFEDHFEETGVDPD